MSSDAIVTEQFNLDTALGEFGYPFAAIDAPELLVDHARTEGDLTMLVHPGGKYVFGDVVSSMPKFLSGKHLVTIARFDPGDTYQRSLEFYLRRAIVSTGLVSSVTIKPRDVTAPSGDTPGTVALDGGASGHSPYTRHLAEQLKVPGLPVESVFKRVRAAVMQETRQAQTPWETSSLVGDWCLRPDADGRCAPPMQPAAPRRSLDLRRL